MLGLGDFDLVKTLTIINLLRLCWNAFVYMSPAYFILLAVADI
jgi:hypothetical protein